MAEWPSGRVAEWPVWPRGHLVTVLVVVCVALTGCEALQRKLTRKRKAQPRPTPVVSFTDYSRTMTPVERYRKHYMMFDYWNEELIESLQSPPLNPKRYRRASAEALGELSTMRNLVTEDVAARITPLLEERSRVDRRLQSQSVGAAEANPLWRQLEQQTRQIQRDFFWRKVEDRLNTTTP